MDQNNPTVQGTVPQPLDGVSQGVTPSMPVDPLQAAQTSTQSLTDLANMNISSVQTQAEPQPVAPSPVSTPLPVATATTDFDAAPTGMQADQTSSIVQPVQPAMPAQQFVSTPMSADVAAPVVNPVAPSAPAPANYDAPYTQEEMNEEILDALDRIEAKLEELEQKI